MDSLQDKLCSIPLLSHLPQGLVSDELNRNTYKITPFKKGALVHSEGEECQELEIVISGELVVNRINIDGNVFTVSHFKQGDVLGGNILFSSDRTYLMNVFCLEDCVLLRIPKDELFSLLQQYPDFLKQFLQCICDTTTVLGNKIRHHVSQSLRERLLNLLYKEYRAQKSNIIRLNMSKKSLAELLGVQRTSLSRELQKMKQLSYIDYDRTTITLLPKCVEALKSRNPFY